MRFRVQPLKPVSFRHLFGLQDIELATHRAMACVADAKPGFPCRVELRDAEPGERLILLNYQHQGAANPYRAAHAIFVIDGAIEARPEVNEIPAMLASRHLSVRAFDRQDMLVDAAVVDGHAAAACFQTLLADPANSYLQVHTAARGCYLAQVERA